MTRVAIGEALGLKVAAGAGLREFHWVQRCPLGPS
jgi:hypothetical protein